MIYTTVNIFGALIEYFALYTFLWILFDYDNSKKSWRIGCSVGMPILFFLFSTYIENIYVRPVLFVVCSWLIAQGFQGDFWARVFSVSVFQIILILLEISISFSLQPLNDISLESFYLTINIFMKLGTLGILMLLFFVSRKRQIIFSELKAGYVLMLLMFSVVSLFLVSFSEYLLMLLDKSILFPIGCLAILLCVGVNIALYYLFYQLSTGEAAKNRLQFIDFYLKRQKEEQSYIDHNYREIQKISHDMKHYLSAIYTMLQQGQVVNAMEALQKRQLEIVQNQLFDTGEPLLNSVLTYKFQVAQECQIRTQLFWNVREKIGVDATDLAIILSNGLDNAIEAACQVKKVRPFLSVRAEMKEDFLKISISNNTATDPEIVEGKIATTKEDKQLHGLGLESIQTIARHYQGESFIAYENHIFTLTVVLKNTLLTENS